MTTRGEIARISKVSDPNQFRQAMHLSLIRFMESYFTSCRDLMHDILRALALALELPSEDELSSTHDKSLFQPRLLHYPPVSAKFLVQDSKSRILAHSDFGTLTLLFQDSVGGLETEDPQHKGTFRSAPPVPDAVLVNVGDLMERWSNKRWRSTVHRVIAPPDLQMLKDGICPPWYSIPFFATADPDTVIEALPGCRDEESNPKQFESVTAWGYVHMRMAALYQESWWFRTMKWLYERSEVIRLWVRWLFIDNGCKRFKRYSP